MTAGIGDTFLYDDSAADEPQTAMVIELVDDGETAHLVDVQSWVEYGLGGDDAPPVLERPVDELPPSGEYLGGEA